MARECIVKILLIIHVSNYTIRLQIVLNVKKETVLDLRVIQNKSYQPGERIIGCLDFYQWEVVRSVRINEETHSDIHKISGRGIGIKENRHGLEGQRHVKLKYNVSSEILKEWNTGPLGNFLRDYKRLGMDKIPKRDD